MKPYKHILLLLFSACTLSAFSTADTSIATPFGNWDQNSTWASGTAPSAANCYDTILIDEHVYVDDQEDMSSCGPIVLIVRDTLRFKSGKKLHLPCGSKVILETGGWLIPEGGGGNSNQLTICGNTEWNAGDGPLGGPTVLSIELLSFTAELKNDAVHLEWVTASEKNNDYFTIQRSKDGLEFEDIATIDGAGNSSIPINYSTVDESPYLGTSYYRLVDTDYNGKKNYSELVAVSNSGLDIINIYPNPSANDVNIMVGSNNEQNIYINITDYAGRKVHAEVRSVPAGYSTQNVAINKLAAGYYVVEVQTENGLYHTQKQLTKSGQ